MIFIVHFINSIMVKDVLVLYIYQFLHQMLWLYLVKVMEVSMFQRLLKKLSKLVRQEDF